MKNWSTDIRKIEQNKDKFSIWTLEQLINFGLNGEKLELAKLKKYWNFLDIDPHKKVFLELLIKE